MSEAATAAAGLAPSSRLIGKALAAMLLLFAAIALGTSIGETTIPVDVAAMAIANKAFGASYPLSPIQEGIIWNYRLTRSIVAAACGAALAVSGLVLQSLLRNALADPYILGISAGASTGAVSVTILGFGAGLVTLSSGAFAGALLAFAFVVLLARAAGGGASTQGTGLVILAGIAGSQLFNALTSYIITRSANAEEVRGIMFWLLGNLSGVRWPDVWLAVPAALVGVLVVLWHRRALDAFTFGSDSAASLGIPVRRIRIVLIGTTAFMTAAMVSIVGSIGFVGLVVPHAARFLVGVQHARLVPVSALLGAVFLVIADILSRTAIPGQVLPISVDVRPFETLGLVGPNGSGKSTLLKLLAGILPPTNGSVLLQDRPMAAMPRFEVARKLAYVEQQADTVERITVRQAVALGRTPWLSALQPWSPDDDAIVSDALAQVDMTAFETRVWHTLSGGEKQRTHLGRALAQRPEILLLDEPTNHLDIHHQLAIFDLVRAMSVTTVIALHDLNQAMSCDRVAVLLGGSLVALGAPADVLSQTLLREVFGVEARFLVDPADGRRVIHFVSRA